MTTIGCLPIQHLGIGDIIIASEASIISTILGSCVSVCLYSPATRIGGMNHFAHPQMPIRQGKEDFRYGQFATERLIREFKQITREMPREWTAKLIGGAHENVDLRAAFNIGQANVEIAREILSRFGIPIIGEDFGGSRGRKVLFHTATNRVQVSKLNGSKAQMLPTGSSNAAAKFPSQITRPLSDAALPRKRRVLIVDDSRTVRDLFKFLLSSDSDLEIVGFAADAFEGAKHLLHTKPDVITLDVNMPGKSGVEWLKEFLPTHPIPVVMISSLELKAGNEIFRALELGAIDYVQKPSLSDLATLGPMICERIKGASHAKVLIPSTKAPTLQRKSGNIDIRKVVAIGASTGGTEALKQVLSMLPERIPPTLIVQHIPPIFSKAFADRLNEICPFEVKEAEDGDELRVSRVLIAPGGKQMKLRQKPSGVYVQITEDEPVNRHKPSVDYLFESVASIFGKNCVGVILTGMGSDGAKGLLKMYNAGAKTIAQDEESCVVFGMPKEAIRLGAAEIILPLNSVANGILNFLLRAVA